MRSLPLLLLAGCSFDHGGLLAGGDPPDAQVPAPDADPNVPDADPNAPDADPTMPDAMPMGCQTWTALNIADPCDDTTLGTPGDIVLASGRNRYDTDTGILTTPIGTVSTPPSVLISQTSGPDARVLVLTSLTIPSGTALVAEGTHPLIVIVYGDATIAGTVDVSATTDAGGATSVPGAGGDDAVMCDTGIPDPGDPTTGTGGAGGGAGGGFGADGGDGGDGNGMGHGGKAGKGKLNGDATLVPLRGGCRGSAGGDDASGLTDDAGRPGNGGGAFEITARGTITVTGTIAASGTGGGNVALTNAGAGGGGSGGAILLDGDVTTIGPIAKLCANGGGGGEGGQTALVASDLGDNAACVESPRAPGGTGNADAGNGGGGGVLAAPGGENGSNGADNAAGGGGGGAVGRIRVHARTTRNLDTNSTISPDPTA